MPVRQHRFLWNSTSETRPPSLRGRIEFPQGSRSQASFTGPLAGSHISHGQRRRYVTTGSKCFTPFFLAGSHRVFPRLCASQACSTGKALSPGTSTPVLEDRPSGVSLSYFSPQPLTGLLASPGTLTGAVLPVRQDRTLKLVPHFCEVSPSCSSPQPLTGLLAPPGTIARAVVPVRQHRFLGTQHPETHPPSLRGRIEFPQWSRSQACSPHRVTLTGAVLPVRQHTGTSTPDLEDRPSQGSH